MGDLGGTVPIHARILGEEGGAHLAKGGEACESYLVAMGGLADLPNMSRHDFQSLAKSEREMRPFRKKSAVTTEKNDINSQDQARKQRTTLTPKRDAKGGMMRINPANTTITPRVPNRRSSGVPDSRFWEGVFAGRMCSLPSSFAFPGVRACAEAWGVGQFGWPTAPGSCNKIVTCTWLEIGSGFAPSGSNSGLIGVVTN